MAIGPNSVSNTSNQIVLGSSTSTVVPGGLLILSNKSGATDPTGTLGMIYFNTTSNTFRCFDGAWKTMNLTP